MDDIHEYLLLKGVEAVAIHGSKSKFIMINMYLLYLVRSLLLITQCHDSSGRT